MEILFGLLTLLAGPGSGAGYLVDQTARNIILAELDQAETLEVRVESIPNYRIFRGEADRILVAGRGLYRKPFPRIELFELETDLIRLRSTDPISLASPLQAAVHIIIREEDVNTALQSPEILSQFENIEADLPFAAGPGQKESTFDLREPQADFLPENRIRLAAQLVEKNESGQDQEAVDIEFNATLAMEAGRILKLEDPEFLIGSVPVPREISGAFLGGLNEIFDLQELDEEGIIIRVLTLSVDENLIEVVGFVRVDTLPGQSTPNVGGLHLGILSSLG
jgi:hypothetical protein